MRQCIGRSYVVLCKRPIMRDIEKHSKVWIDSGMFSIYRFFEITASVPCLKVNSFDYIIFFGNLHIPVIACIDCEKGL